MTAEPDQDSGALGRVATVFSKVKDTAYGLLIQPDGKIVASEPAGGGDRPLHR